MSHKYKIVLAYDGTNFCGWQVQKNGISIQSLLQKALSTALRAPTPITGSGRTDAGVHAKGQVAHFTSSEPIDADRLLASLNGLLPEDIRILSIEEVPLTFHARYSAKSKIYHYTFDLDRTINPFTRLYTTRQSSLNLELMKNACQHFIGTHDFTSFANEGDRGSASRCAVRTLTRLDLFQTPNGIRLEFEGDGFLYKMVRNIVGTLLEVAKQKLSPDSIQTLLAAKDRKKAPAAAPPQGLCLVEVRY